MAIYWAKGRNYWNRPVQRVLGVPKKNSGKKDIIFRYKSYDFDRGPHYANTFTERQLKIIYGEMPWEVVPAREITVIIKKAQFLGDEEVYQKAVEIKEKQKHRGEYVPTCSPEEAKEILKTLDQGCK